MKNYRIIPNFWNYPKDKCRELCSTFLLRTEGAAQQQSCIHWKYLMVLKCTTPDTAPL